MIITLSILAAFVLTRTPENLDLHFHGSPSFLPDLGDGSLATEASPVTRLNLFHDRSFLTLCAGMTLALFAQTGLVVHLVSVLMPALGRQGAGLAAGALGVAAVIGRIIISSRASRGSKWRVIASFSLIVQIIGCGVLMLTNGSNPILMAFGVVFFGLGIGNAISVPQVIANLEFSKTDAARVVSLIVAISQGAYAMAPMIFGLFRQNFSDATIFFAALIIDCLAIVAYLSCSSIKDRRCCRDNVL